MQRDLVEGLQPIADLGGGDICLLQQLAHGEEAVELARECPVRYSDAGFTQTMCVFVTFVTLFIYYKRAGIFDKHRL